MKVTIEVTDKDEIKTTTEGVTGASVFKICSLVAALEYEKLAMLQAFASGLTVNGDGNGKEETETSQNQSDRQVENACHEDGGG